MRRKKSKATIAAELEDAYQKFWTVYRPDRHRMGTKLYDRIKTGHYAARTVYGIVDEICAFECRHCEHSGWFMCFVPIGRKFLGTITVAADGYIQHFGGIDRASERLAAEMNEQLKISPHILASEYCGSIGSLDFTDTNWFKAYGASFSTPEDGNAKTTIFHFAGEDHATIESNEKWCLEWVQKKSVKYPDIKYFTNGNAVTATLPFQWLLLTNKSNKLPHGAGRLEQAPSSEIDIPKNKSCTIFEHIGGNSTATVYAGEAWSQDLLKKYSVYYPKSVPGTLPTKTGASAYIIPAGWLLLSPPNQQTRKYIINI